MKHLKEYNSGSNDEVIFDDESKLRYYKRLWDSLNIKYTQYNTFFPKIFKKMMEKKKLSRLQWAELEFLLKNGKSRYEAGILPKNYR
jgi:hypothetical protein